MGILNESPVPETYAGSNSVWWDQSNPGATFVDGDMTLDEAFEKGGLNWTVSHRRIRPEGLDGEILDTPTPGWEPIYRDSDNKFLGMVTPTWQPFQNEELKEIATETLRQSNDDVKVTTIGSLYGGKIVWVMAKFDKDFHIRTDNSPISDYLGLFLGHDGRHALTAVSTEVRVLCGNTALQAINKNTGKISLRHTSGMKDRVPDIIRALKLHYDYREQLQGFLTSLTYKPMTIDAFKAYTEVLIPAKVDDDEKVSTRTANKRAELVDLFANSVTLDGVDFTAYRAYQATIEWADHRVTFNDTKTGSGLDRKALSMVYGPTYDLKTTAAKLLVKA
jgi:phage/plasmid-like protein (TIGR03299 family)